MKNKRYVFMLFCLIASWQGFAQTGIGTTTPDASAKLEIASTSKGFLVPRMTAAQKTAISLPATGLLIYQTDVPVGFYVNTGTSASPTWLRLSNDWVKSGNDISYTTGNVSTTGNLTGGSSTSSKLSGFGASISSKSGSYSLVAADNGTVISFTSATAVTLTIPTGLPDGFNCMVVQQGAGQVTLAGSGLTPISRNSYTKTIGQYALATILHLGSNVVIISGELSN
jgi:hypothetical protein